jgi:hypothetical protein
MNKAKGTAKNTVKEIKKSTIGGYRRPSSYNFIEYFWNHLGVL